MRITAIDHIVLTARDVDRSVAFYRDVLGMEVESFTAADGTRRQALRFGRQKINLHRAGAEFAPHAAAPVPGSLDLCFLVEGSLQDWADRLAAHGIAVEEGPVARTGATGPIRSIYLRDPDGALIELSVPDRGA